MTASLRTRDRLAAAFVLAVMGLGCVGLFVGVPVLVLWGLANLTDSFAAHFVGGVLGIPLAIALLSPALLWLNGLYLRITGVGRDEEGWDELGDPMFRVHGPLEPMLVVAFVVAVVAITVWFFFFAENPLLTA